jgi:gas vesicle protein
MSEEGSGGGSNLGFFLAGLGLGTAVALLLAPKSGKEAREFIAGKAEEGRDYVRAKSEDLRRQAEGAVEKGKDLVTKQKDLLSAALEAGKQAYAEEKTRTK